MTPESIATTDINSENSLICPRRIPIDVERFSDSPMRSSSQRNTGGLSSRATAHNTSAGRITGADIPRSIRAPSEKKNRIRKKSLNGFRLSETNSATGADASDTPAMKAPISAESCSQLASCATPRHQPIATRNINSRILSNRRIRGISKYFVISHVKSTSSGSFNSSSSGSHHPMAPCPELSPAPFTSTSSTIASKSCNSRIEITTSPVRW